MTRRRPVGARDGRRAGGRGQTTLDFTIGVAVFIVAVVFVLTFLPSMFEPFAQGTQSDTVIADRLVTQLSTGMLTEPGTPFTLSVACTTDFFNGTGATLSECGFDDSEPLQGRLGLVSRQSVNVSLVGDADGDGARSVLCRTATDEVVEVGSASCQTPLTADSGGGSGTATVARRAVTIAGRTAMLEVKLWG